MKQHTSQLKTIVKTMGKELDSIITYGNTTLHDELYSISVLYEGNMLKSIMKQLDIESSVDIEINTILNYRLGIKVGEDYEYLDYGNFVVTKSEKQEDTNTYKITCYDKMVYSMKEYESLDIQYPIKVKNYLSAIASTLNLTLKNTTFYNQDLYIQKDLYEGLGYTYRDILDEIAQATGSIIIINEDDKLEVKYPTITGDTINEEYLKDINVTFGEKYGPINSVVLSRAGGSDSIYAQDSESVQQNGLCEVKIQDNQIMNDNNRSDFLPGLLSALDGLEYYINDFSSTGICYYDIYDKYNIQIGQNTYNCLMLNDEINVTSGLEELIHADMPEQSETDYTKADKTDRQLNKTYIIVDKQEQTIEAVVENVGEQNQKIARISQDIDEIKSEIQDIADVTESEESNYASVSIEKVNESEPVRVVVHPILTNISYLYPRNNLYPSDNLYMPIRRIRFIRTYEEDEETKTQNIDYDLPMDLLYYDSENYDEFILDYGSQTCVINKKIGYNADGTTYILQSPQTIELPYPYIPLGDGNYTITILGYNQGYIFVRLMVQNLYTDQFATKIELNSAITQTTQSINLSVDEKLTNYSTTNEMNSAINVKADEITSSVSNTYETKDNANNNYQNINNNLTTNYYTKTQTNSQIDQKADQITSSVSATYITKSDSATNIANAKSEAIASANSTTDSKLTNYSTTTQMNSAINQKANQITQSVSETYETKSDSVSHIATAKNEAINSANSSTDQKLTSYSTTTQMNSAIDQKANQITTSVSQTYSTKTETTNAINSIDVGGRNYALGTGTAVSVLGSNINNQTGRLYNLSLTKEEINAIESDKLLISFDIEISNQITTDSPDIYIGQYNSPYQRVSVLEKQAGKYHKEIKLSNRNWTTNVIGYRLNYINTNCTIKFSNVKFEIGNKYTDWTPAPEDVNTELTTNYYTKSVIDQKTDAINLEVEGKFDEEDFTGANIMLAVNNDSSSATINADKISLSRKNN